MGADQEALRNLGWRVGIVWECETRKVDLSGRLAEIVEDSGE